jgi:hypothetical protein
MAWASVNAPPGSTGAAVCQAQLYNIQQSGCSYLVYDVSSQTYAAGVGFGSNVSFMVNVFAVGLGSL